MSFSPSRNRRLCVCSFPVGSCCWRLSDSLHSACTHVHALLLTIKIQPWISHALSRHRLLRTEGAPQSACLTRTQCTLGGRVMVGRRQGRYGGGCPGCVLGDHQDGGERPKVHQGTLCTNSLHKQVGSEWNLLLRGLRLHRGNGGKVRSTVALIYRRVREGDMSGSSILQSPHCPLLDKKGSNVSLPPSFASCPRPQLGRTSGAGRKR